MVSFDANLLLYGYSKAAPEHEPAHQFIQSLAEREDVALSEFVLTEFYLLLRNPAVLVHPLSAPEAVRVVQSYRQHPRWRIIGFPQTSRELHDELWKRAAARNSPGGVSTIANEPP